MEGNANKKAIENAASAMAAAQESRSKVTKYVVSPGRPELIAASSAMTY